MISAKELSMSADEQTIWMETNLKRLSESLRVIELLIRDENDDLFSHILGYAPVIKEIREYFMCISEQLECIGWISILDKGTEWYEDLINVAICYNKEQNIYRKAIHEECNRAMEIWNDMVYMLMN